MPVRVALAAAAAGTALALIAVSPAAAHPELVSSTPGNGEQVESAPAAVVLNFSEPVSELPDGVMVLDRAGRRADSGDVSVEGSTVHVGLQADLTNGSYVVRWGVVGSDGHPLRGAFVFAIGEPVSIGPGDVVIAGPPAWPAWVASFARGAQYLAVALAIGFAAFALFVREDVTGRRRVALVGLAAVAGAAAALVAEMLRLTNGDWSDLLDSGTWRLAEDARLVPGALMAAGGGLVLAGWGLRQMNRLGAIAGAGVMAVGLAWAGHSAGVEPEWAGVGLDVVHVLAIGAWAGGLAALMLWLRRSGRTDGAADTVSRFSWMATVAFPLAAVTGGVLLWQIVNSASDLVETTYGRLVVAKVAIVTVAGVAAYWNRSRVVSALRRGDDRTVLLRKLLGVEFAALLVVFGVTATLTGQSPTGGRAAAEVPEFAPYVSDQFSGPYHVLVTLSPREVGVNVLTVDFHAISETGEMPPVSVTATFSIDQGGAGPAIYELTHGEGSRFAADAVEIPVEGRWTLTIDAILPDGTEQEVVFPVRVPR